MCVTSSGTERKVNPVAFATQSEAGLSPQRHHDWISQLTEGTPRPLTKAAGLIFLSFPVDVTSYPFYFFDRVWFQWRPVYLHRQPLQQQPAATHVFCVV
jgi:hypothetical protein